MEQAAQVSGGVTIPENVQEMTERDTECHGLFDLVVLVQRLHLLLEVSSNLKDSMIL